MNLFIETDENGNYKNHPAFDDNLRQAFGEIPAHWEPFVRVERPIPGVYQVLESDVSSYEKVDGIWTDVWAIREMTAEEKAAKQQQVKDEWASNPNASNFSAWTFDEEKCAYVAPIPMPEDDKTYFWQGTTNSWVEVPEYPTDGKAYKLDYATGTWVLIEE